mgnify:CR=1 FL=1
MSASLPLLGFPLIGGFGGGGSGGTPVFGSRLIQPGALAGGGLVTFSRAQTGATSTAISSGGGGNWWAEFAADAPRFGGSANRLMLGGQRTTMNTRQRLIGGTGWTNTNVTATLVTGPDGGSTANRLDEGTAASTHQTGLTSVSFTSGLSYSISAIVKAETCTSCQLFLPTGAFGTTTWQNFDLAVGVLGTGGAGAINPRIVFLGSDWYWISFTALAIATSSVSPFTLIMTSSASAARNESYTGTNRTMLAFWGWAEDSAAFPSSAILATSEPNAATRGQDNLTSSFSTLFPSGVGTVLSSFVLPFNASGADQTLVSLNDGTTSRFISLVNQPARTNAILNPRGEGGTPGVIGAGGVMPTDWVLSSFDAGLTITFNGSGTENGTPYSEFRLSGTSAAGTLGRIAANTASETFLTGTSVAVQAGFRVVAGSLTGITSVSRRTPTLGSTSSTVTPSSTLSVANYIQVLAADVTAVIGCQTQINHSVGVPLDVTFRIYAPMISRGAVQTTPPLPPVGTPGASTRAAGTITLISRDTAAGVYSWADLGTQTPGTLFRVGMAFDGTTIAGNFNGGTNQTVAGQPTGLTTLRVGNISAGTAPMFGEAGYFDTLPYATPGANLPAAVTAIP